MHLKRIKLAGFKSFVEPQVLEFNHAMSCIVGPNGCGKSNVIDAVKWVIGESSAKYLRSEQMSDVIFNGSTSRQPVGQAQVELIFDNSESILKGQWAEYQEISIRRSIYRDGQSNYYLNGTKCRRKDIIDLFLGTGLGQRSYAIIEQGMVSRFIDAKPVEIRAHIEEAAGISRYKEKRKETVSKLEETQDNLSRLEDLKKELEVRVAGLAVQAEQAARYQELRGQLVRTRQALLALSYNQADQERVQVQQELERLQLAQQSLEQELQQFRLKHAQDFKRVDEIEMQVRSIEQQHKNLALSKKDKFHQLQQARTTYEFLLKGIEEAKLRLDEIDLQLKTCQDQLADLETKKPQDNKLEWLAQLRKEHESKVKQIQDLLAQKQIGYKKLLNLKQEPKQQVEIIKTKIQHAEHQILQRNAAVDNFEKETENLLQLLPSLNYSVAKQEVEDAQKIIAQKNTVIEGIDLDLEQSQNQRLQLEQEAARKQEQYLNAQQELKKIQHLIERRSAQVSTWLDQEQDAYEVFAKHLPEKKYQQALSMACGTEFLYYGQSSPTIEQLQKIADRDLEYIWGNKATHFAFNQQIPQPSYWKDWIYCESYEQAIDRLGSLSEQDILLLPNGSLMGNNWLRPARQKPQVTSAHLKSQEQELILLVESKSVELHDCQKKLIEIKEKINQLLQTKRIQSEELKNASRDQQQASIKAERLYQQYVATQDKLNKLKEQIDQAKKNRSQQQDQIQQFRSQIEELTSLIEEQETSFTVLEQEITVLQEDYHHHQQTLKQYQDEQQQVMNIVQQWQLQYQKVQAYIESLHQQKKIQDKDLADKLAQDKELATPIGEYQLLLEQAENEFIQVENHLTQTTELLVKYQGQLRELVSQEKKIEQQLAVILKQLHQQEILSEKNLLELRHLIDQILDFGWEVEQIKLIETDTPLASLKKSVIELTASIEAMGQVNLRALEEHQKERSRLDFIEENYLDVHQATQELLAAIAQLDFEIAQTFDETFNKLNTSFQRLFPTLFGGGQASLVRLAAEDGVEEGIVIKAQPPGKKNATLAVLSGGEKALTAAALVFSFFQLNPAPFCLLDEVDAPLDDTNTLRLAKMIRTLSDEIQFIVVTHSKIMMEQGDVLFGVTMKEPGVSRLVDVDMKAALEMTSV